MKIARNGNTLEPAWKFKAVCLAITVLCGSLSYLFLGILKWIFVGSLLAFWFACLLWIDFMFLFDRIEIHDNCIRARHAFRVVTIDWEDIVSITREKGRGIAFKLKNGAVQYGPDLGNAMSTANVLRARLKSRNNPHSGC